MRHPKPEKAVASVSAEDLYLGRFWTARWSSNLASDQDGTSRPGKLSRAIRGLEHYVPGGLLRLSSVACPIPRRGEVGELTVRFEHICECLLTRFSRI